MQTDFAQDMETAQRTAQLLMEMMRASGGPELKIVADDPHVFEKHQPAFVRLRLLPASRQPRAFWDKDWCMYVISVGPWADVGAQLGSVSFVMYPQCQKCGGGIHASAVRGVLSSIHPERPVDFFCDLQAGGKRNAYYCGFRYGYRHKAFPVEQAAKDLAWLIHNTCRKFAGSPTAAANRSPVQQSAASTPSKPSVTSDAPKLPRAMAATPTSGQDVSRTRKRLADTARRLAQIHKGRLDELKAEHAQLERPDFLWHFLLQSFATMGRAAGWQGLIGNKANYDRVRFQNLDRLPTAQRARQVEATCRDAKIRMPGIKAGYILGCFDRVKSLGGLEAAKAELLRQSGREAKIQWLKAFPGIGDKYARNIMMDVYHEDFRDSIAIDARIQAVSQAHGLSFRDYASHEAFYLSVAAEAGLNGWELDRLLFNYQAEFLRTD